MQLNDDNHVEDVDKAMPHMVKMAERWGTGVGPWVDSRSTASGGILNCVTRYDSLRILADAVQEFGWRNDWIWREVWRLSAGEYEELPALPHSFSRVPGHFLHRSKEDKKLVSYTPTEKHGREDRQVRTTLGRYLTKFEERLELSDSQINDITRWWSAINTEPSLIITNDEEEICYIYQNGPNSCMSADKVRNRPYRVYAGPDTAVAAYVAGSTVQGSMILARSVVVPEDKAYVRLYADDAAVKERFKEALEAEGYEHDLTALRGKRLALIEDYGRVVCPYVDGVEYGHSNGDHLVLTDDSDDELNLQYTDGYAEENGAECSDCGCRTNSDDLTTTTHNDSCVCESCLRDGYTYAYIGRGCQEWVENDDVVGYDCDDDAFTEEGAEAYNLVFPEDEGRWGGRKLMHESDLIETEDGTFYQSEEGLDQDGYRVTIDDKWVQASDSNYAETEDGEFVHVEDMRDHGYYEIEVCGCTRYVREHELGGFDLELGPDGEPREIVEEEEKRQYQLISPPRFSYAARKKEGTQLTVQPAAQPISSTDWVMSIDGAPVIKVDLQIPHLLHTSVTDFIIAA